MIKFIIKTILYSRLILLCVTLYPFTVYSDRIRLESIQRSGLLYQGTAGNQAGRDGSEWQLYGAISGLAGQDCPWRLVTYNSELLGLGAAGFLFLPIQST